MADEEAKTWNNDPSGSSEPKPDQVLGDFRIIREIGRGGMGTVFEAEQISLGRTVALKVLPPHLSFSGEAVSKFRREAEAGGRQHHPGIVMIHGVGEHGGVHYIAQELVEGGYTLADRLETLRKEKEQPPDYFKEVAEFVAETADALQHAHESGVIHRDVKPSNILLTREGTPKVTDFGLARVEDALALSRTGDFAGTPYYMSPEQAASRRIGIDHRTDIFSLGVTLYEMLTLERPFKGNTSQEVLKKILLYEPRDPRLVTPAVPKDLAVVCLKALEKRPNQRYETMWDFAKDLRRFLSGKTILARPAGPIEKSKKWIRRNAVLAGIVGAALGAVMLTVLVLWAFPGLLIDKDEDRKSRWDDWVIYPDSEMPPGRTNLEGNTFPDAEMLPAWAILEGNTFLDELGEPVFYFVGTGPVGKDDDTRWEAAERDGMKKVAGSLARQFSILLRHYAEVAEADHDEATLSRIRNDESITRRLSERLASDATIVERHIKEDGGTAYVLIRFGLEKDQLEKMPLMATSSLKKEFAMKKGPASPGPESAIDGKKMIQAAKALRRDLSDAPLVPAALVIADRYRFVDRLKKLNDNAIREMEDTAFTLLNAQTSTGHTYPGWVSCENNTYNDKEGSSAIYAVGIGRAGKSMETRWDTAKLNGFMNISRIFQTHVRGLLVLYGKNAGDHYDEETLAIMLEDRFINDIAGQFIVGAEIINRYLTPDEEEAYVLIRLNLHDDFMNKLTRLVSSRIQEQFASNLKTGDLLQIMNSTLTENKAVLTRNAPVPEAFEEVPRK